MPEISIIVPVYNVEKYLHQCVDSILTQTFTNFELLLVDDGSSDSSPTICDYYAKKDRRVRVFHKTNEGVSIARNTGLNNAKGEYITFVDSDDKILQNYLRDMISLMRSNTQLVLSDLSGNEKEEIVNIELTPQIFADHPHILSGSPVNKLFLRSIIRDNDLSFPDNISTMEDNIFVWKYIAKCKTISITATNSYIYNQHDGSLVRSIHKIEEIYRLCHQIMPAYTQLMENFMPETVSKCDNYLYVACLKRLLISNCSELTFIKCKKVVSESIEVMQPVIRRMSERSDLTKKDLFLLKIMKYRWIWLLSSYSMLNSLKYSRK